MKNKLGKLDSLLYKHPYGWHHTEEDIRKFIKNNFFTKSKTDLTELIEIYDLARELNISKSELSHMWSKQGSNRYKNRDIYNAKPLGVTRDNKKTYNYGSGGSQHSTRYPSKKRSKKTWVNFYKLFPRLAERDNWNGETSDKMK